jgi:4-amino-4-deoxy-L-arabinose transferase-like glycosyltransferase
MSDSTTRHVDDADWYQAAEVGRNSLNLRSTFASRSIQRIHLLLDAPPWLRQVFGTTGVAVLLTWLVIVAIFGARMAVNAMQDFGTGRGGDIPIMGEPRLNFATPYMLWAAALVYLACSAAAIVARKYRAGITLPVTYAMGGVVFAVGAISTESAAAVVLVVAMLGLVWLVGDAVLSRFSEAPEEPAVRLPIAGGLGLGIVGLVLLVLAVPGWLNATTVIAGGVLTTLALIVFDRHRLADNVSRLTTWRPNTPTWFETVITSMVVGLVSFALLAVFVPENQNDAYRHHLPIAREIWQSGSVADFPPMGTSRDPILGHTFYAVAYGFGGMVGAKLVQAVVGLGAIVGVAGIGLRCSGRVAAVVGGAIFASIPVVLWELGHAFPDLIAVLFAVGALLCVLLWQQYGLAEWLVTAGALAGFGFTAKLTMGWVIVAMAAGLFLAGRSPWRWGNRLFLVILFGIGAFVAVPWLVRTFMLTGMFLPGLEVLTDRLAGALPSADIPTGAVSTAVGTDNFHLGALGSGLNELVQIPWQLTFHSEQFPNTVTGGGDIGIALLMLLPFALFGPYNRATSFLALTMIASCVGWVFTHQVIRHLLPTLAIAAALSGIGVANISTLTSSRARTWLTVTARFGVCLGLVAAAFIFLPAERARLPIDLMTGRETAAEYVQREIPRTTMLTSLDSLLEADTPVGYVGRRGGAQIYTQVRLTYLDRTSEDSLNSLVGTAPDDVLANLDRQGISYVIWDRPETRPFDWRSTLLSTEFLKRHARILASDGGAYLFGIVSGSGNHWATNSRKVLTDSTFQNVRKDDSSWLVTGDFRAKQGLLTLGPGSSVAQHVPVTAGRPYLLMAFGACAHDNDRMTFLLRWFDAQGADIGADEEQVIPGTERGEQFLWRRAPEGAAGVSAELATSANSKCDIEGVSLLEQP